MKAKTPSGLIVPSLLLVVTLLALLPIRALGAPLEPLAQPAAVTLQGPPDAPPVQADPPADDADPSGTEWKEWEALPSRMQAKVDPRILAELRGEVLPAHLEVRRDRAALPPKDAPPANGRPPSSTRFLVTLQAQADLEAVRAHARASGQTGRQALVQQRTAVVNALVETARATQGPVKALLDARMASGDTTAYTPLYIVNGLAVEGNLATLIALARREDVLSITANYRLVQFKQQDTAAAGYPASNAAPGSAIGGLDPANWNVDMIDAERVWNELGIDGRGAVVADFDTGVDWDHAALRDQYRGWDGTTANHNYNWFEFDAQNLAYWDTDGDYGPSASTIPFDCSEHGTHTLGTMVGDGGTPSTQIGVAPGAQWIAVPGICGRTMPNGYADTIGGIRTFQWLICPTDLSGELSTRDCSKAPDVINNSWGSSNPADDTFRPIVQALRAAGIVPVFASGNPSAGPGSIGTPASIPEAIAVGATNSDDVVTSFSGRGPSFYEGVQKPELAAPGHNVRSSIPGGGYTSFSGTSMAAPHVSGLVALMISADLQDGQRDLDVDELLAFMQYSAVDLAPAGPDDEYGYGRIDAYRAVRWALGAGDLQGVVRDANTQAPIGGAGMTGVALSTGDRFVARADAGGVYSTTVPGGVYDVHVEAFGYAGKTFAGVTVLTGTNTLVDFALAPLPTHLLTGRVLSTSPVQGARVYVDARPALSYTTRADGAYALRLPAGQHDITVEASGYRIAHATVTVVNDNTSQNFDLLTAPSILLVEADAYRGWFGGRPARNFFRYALDDRGFMYDTYVVTNPTSPPNLAPTDGSRPYDVVIWAHTYGSPGVSGPETVNALTRYLDNGGRLILSGQDIGRWDGIDQAYYGGYLHARYRTSSASQVGGTVSGSRFLAGIDLTLNEAALYSFPNTVLTLSPDGVAPLDGNAYPVLTYDSGLGDAALAIDPCDRPFRAVYLAVGYENLGPRAYDRPPEHAELLERSIEWLSQDKKTYDVALFVTPIEQMSRSGARVSYDLTIANTGRLLDTYQVSLSGSAWQTQIYSGSVMIPPAQTIALSPCSQQDLTVVVDIPGAIRAGEQDRFEVAVASLSSPAVTARTGATTTAFPPWQTEAPMPTPRYRLAAAYLPGDIHFYVIGGLGGDTWSVPLAANERYNTCTGRWDTMAPMPTPRGNVSAAVIDGKIYVPGGYIGDSSPGTTHLDVLEIYDPASNSWSSGAAMPEPLAGMAVAAYDGKLYIFGGATPKGDLSNKTFVYDPVDDTWQARAPLPRGGLGFAAAATLNDKIYVAGGWYVNTVEVYDPAADTWSIAAPMNQARQSPGMTVAPDGRLYVSGGGTDTWTGLDSAERYDPVLNRWQMLLPLADADRAGSASAYAGGRIYAVGGVGSALSSSNESLQLFSSFCQSAKHTPQDTAYPFESPIPAQALLPVVLEPRVQAPAVQAIDTGTGITYTITLYSDDSTLDAASVADPIPQGTTFGRFGDNAAGATYDAAQNRVLWNGTIPAGSPPLSFTFGVDVDLAKWHHGDVIVNEATFASGAGIVFTRTAATQLNFPDPSTSVKTVNKVWATAGDLLTYTLQIRNPSTISDVITVVDPLPAHTTYVPGSLTYQAGDGAYDEETRTIRWSAILPSLISYRVVGYDWGDSNGGGTVPGVVPDWHDMTGAIDAGVSSDDGLFGTFPIGFAFDYWGANYEAFYVSPNGWVGFSSDLGTIVSCSDYGSSGTPNNFIGGFGGDRAVFAADGGSIAYKLFGAEPNRRLVVQFTNIRYRYYSDADTLDMQIVLYEESREILVQYRDLTTSPIETATGLEGPGPNYPHRLYKDTCLSEIQDGLAILFRPQLMPALGHETEVSYAATVDASTPNNTWITNTAALSSSFVSVQRKAGTLVDPIDLSASTKSAPTQVAGRERIAYTLLLKNDGMRPADKAVLEDPIPPHTAFATGSLACSSGACTYSGIDQTVRWSGSIAPGETVTLTFAVALTEFLADRTPITNTATLADGYGSTHTLRAVTLARTSDLSGSFQEALPGTVQAGETATYTIHVHNAGVVDTEGEVRDALPAELVYVPGSLSCGAGVCSADTVHPHDAVVITWEGTVHGKSVVPIRFQATVSPNALPGQQIRNEATVRDRTTGRSYSVAARVHIPGMARQTFYLPIVAKSLP